MHFHLVALEVVEFLPYCRLQEDRRDGHLRGAAAFEHRPLARFMQHSYPEATDGEYSAEFSARNKRPLNLPP